MARDKTGDFRVGRGLTDYVFVDVDGTLIDWRGMPAGSWDNAPTVNSRCLDAICIAKPDIAVDDGLNLRCVLPHEFVCPDN